MRVFSPLPFRSAAHSSESLSLQDSPLKVFFLFQAFCSQLCKHQSSSQSVCLTATYPCFARSAEGSFQFLHASPASALLLLRMYRNTWNTCAYANRPFPCRLCILSRACALYCLFRKCGTRAICSSSSF